MGNLHLGHLSLVKKAQQLADKVVVSIFVNPLQFNDQADLSAYPRTLEADIDKLIHTDCDLLFTPRQENIYPKGMKAQTRVIVPDMDDKLCGLHRPGHFDGVATVVLKLFNLVQADVAIFGEKDYQQLLLIKKMAADLNLAIEIEGAPTCREANGLAMSSRNQYLTDQQYQIAGELYNTMLSIAEQLSNGNKAFLLLCEQAKERLRHFGFEPEYVDIRCENDLELASDEDKELRIFIAARLGKARLIDNLACNLA
jgi:pantoate--beta-alanine ligase